MENKNKLSESEIKGRIINLLSDNFATNDSDIIEKTLKFVEKSVKNKITFKDEKALMFSKIMIEETGAGINTVCASIIYASIESKYIDIKEVSVEINGTVAGILSGLLKIPVLRKEKYTKNVENFINFLLTVTGDLRSILIRLAEQIYLMRNIETFDENRQVIYSQQTSELFAPLAHRLGLYKIKTELEETAMKYTNREMYKFIAKKLQETKRERDKYIADFIKPIEQSLTKAGFNFTVKGRPKSIFSIWKKMQKQNVSFEEVYDLFAIRIILKTPIDKEKDECWRVYSVITDSYKPNPKRLRDWISAPKAGGYESLHTTVLGHENKWIEVQIRTERMDEIAEKGPAAHWKYKGNSNEQAADWLSVMRQALENPAEVDDDTNDEIKSAMYSSEIFVFTPDGDLKRLKPGYTVLDFAFGIHSKIGSTCSGAIVNGFIKPLNYEIKNGDTVKILTNKNKKPNDEWLNIAKSSRVKTKIRQILKVKDLKFTEQGKEILKQKFQQLKIEFSEKNLLKVSNFFGIDEPLLFYQQLGEGKIDLLKIKKAFDVTEIETDAESKLKELKTELHDTVIQSTDWLVIDENITALDYKLSKCCNPVPGDKIFGFITVAKGTKIHKISCPNAKDLLEKYPYRVVRAKWNDKNLKSDFITNIYIAGKDQTGVTAAVTRIISEEYKLKMKAISLNARKDNMFDGMVVLYVKDREQVTNLIDRLKKLKDIIYVKEK